MREGEQASEELRDMQRTPEESGGNEGWNTSEENEKYTREQDYAMRTRMKRLGRGEERRGTGREDTRGTGEN